MSSQKPDPRQPAGESRSSDAETPELSEETRIYYERLQQTGQLIDVDDDTDLRTLPPNVTHVRRPDGTIERIGYSTSPYRRS